MPFPRPRERPAETGGVIASLVVVTLRAFGVHNADVIAAAGAWAGVMPALITWFHDHVWPAK